MPGKPYYNVLDAMFSKQSNLRENGIAKAASHIYESKLKCGLMSSMTSQASIYFKLDVGR